MAVSAVAAQILVFVGGRIAQPNFVVGLRTRREVHRQLIGQRLHFRMHRIVVVRRRAAHHIPFHVAASGQRRKLDFVDPSNRFLQVALRHAMQLQSLPARDPQRSISQLVAHRQLAKQLIGRHFSARYRRADHENVLPEALAPFLFHPLLTIILLIRSVKLQQRGVVFVKLVRRLVQLLARWCRAGSCFSV